GAVGHDDFTLVARSDGGLRTWGANGSGQLGDGSVTNRTTPQTPTGLDSIVAVAGGTAFSVAVSSDGRVWTWGDNTNNQLGDGTTDARHQPNQISDAGFAWRVAMPHF